MVAQYSFEEQIQFGDENEDIFRVLFRTYGYAVIHTSRLRNEEGKGGSRLYLPFSHNPSEIPIPDFLCIRDHQSVVQLPAGVDLPPIFFPDLKAKRKADYYRKRSRWETGIDIRCRNNYLLAQKVTSIQSWVFHLIYPTSESAMNEQYVPFHKRPAPTGLFGCPITQKANEYNGMIYWGICEDMIKIAELDQIRKIKP